MSIKEVGRTKLSDNVRQTIYKDYTKDLTLLFSHMPSGSRLKRHSHSETQFGYIYMGQLEFTYNEKKLVLKKDDSYLLDSKVKHGGYVLEELYSLDIKYNSEKMDNIFWKNVLNEYGVYSSSKIKICKIKGKNIYIEVDNKNFIDTYIGIYSRHEIVGVENGKRINIKNLGIYHLDQSLELKSNSSITVIVISVKGETNDIGRRTLN